MAAADMTAWSAQVVERFKTLLNAKAIDDETDDEGLSGDSDETKIQRAAIARNRHPADVQAAHEGLAALAFDGYRDWCEYDDDAWTKNCLGQVLDDDQSQFLVSALEGAGLIDLTTAVELLAGPYLLAWRAAAESEAAEAGAATIAGLTPLENTESWKYSRTPGTRYYIFHDGQYLFSDDKNAPLADWATAEFRDDQASARATEWESGSNVFYTGYDNPAHVGGVTHVFGQSKDGPWVLSRSQAEDLLAASRLAQDPGDAAGAGSPIEPYFSTGHFTKYDNGTYLFGETADAVIWYATYQELLDSLGARAPLIEPSEEPDDETDDETDDLSPEDIAEDLIRMADSTGDDAYQAAANLLGDEELRRLAIEIARLS